MTDALRKLDPRQRAALARRRRMRRSGGFDPRQISAVTGWLRLQSSTQSAGEWTNWFDVIAGNHASYNAARRAAVATSAEGLPLANFQTNDCASWPIAASNFNTSTFGIFLDVAPDATGTTQVLWCVANGTAAASHKVIVTYFLGTTWTVDCYINDADGRSFTFASAATAGTQRRYGIEYDSSVGGDGCLTVSLNGVITSATGVANIGAGGSLGALQSVTGKLLLGNFNDGAASSPLNGKEGPHAFALTSKMAGATSGLLTTAQRALLAGYERPT